MNETGKIYGYARVSSRDQNEDRQLIALLEMPLSSAMLNTSLTEFLDMCLVVAIELIESFASRSCMISFTSIFLAILLASLR